jgi:hypothetical protein
MIDQRDEELRQAQDRYEQALRLVRAHADVDVNDARLRAERAEAVRAGLLAREARRAAFVRELRNLPLPNPPSGIFVPDEQGRYRSGNLDVVWSLIEQRSAQIASVIRQHGGDFDVLARADLFENPVGHSAAPPQDLNEVPPVLDMLRREYEETITLIMQSLLRT